MNNPQSKLLLPLCYLISAFSAFADTETIAGIEWYYTISSEKATIGSGVWQGRGAIETSCTGTVSIPDVLGGCPVTYINHFAFDGCSGLTAITIPDSVTSIGDFAFRDCPGLTSITIPDSVASIGDFAFEGCSGLTSITIPDGVTSIGYDAFFKCTGLEEVHISDLAAWCGISFASGLANPCYHAHRLFLNGEEVKALVVPDGVTSIGAYAFDGCSGLKSITIPDSVTSVGDSAFRDCPGLTSITIPDGVTSIGNGAFSGCSGLTSITIPDSVTSIGESAFEGCSGLTSLTIPDSVTTIGQHTFYGCSGLTSITIPDSVASIGHSAFRDCSGLTSVAIPNRVTSIDGFAFSGCSGLKEVVIPGRFQLSAVFPESYNRITNAIVALGSEIITSSAFAGCSGLIAITIPDSVTRIGDSAFSGCSKLEAVNISDVDAWCRILFTSSLSNPLGYAHHLFLDDCEVTSVTTPDGLDYVHDYFLYGGSSLTSVTIPDGVTSIGNGAFSGCSGLTSITIPDSVTSIGESAFEGCSGLTSLTIPDSVTSIGENTFFDCSGLSSITIPDGVTSLECGAFCGCSGLTSIVIPESVTSIKDYAFFGCSGLTTITIPDGVTRIENETFSACLGLTSVTIPDSVMFIWSSAFQDCCNIRNVAMPGSFRMSSTFPDSYSAITNLVLTSGTTQLAEQFVVGCSELFSIVVPEDNTTYASRDGILFSKDGETLFAYPCGRTNSYAIPADVRVIGTSAFEGCSRMEWVDIPDGVLSIGSRAFYGCSGLTSITIPESVTSIGDNTFSGCSDMEWIRIPRCFENRITALSLPASCLILYYDCVASLAISSRYGHPKESGDGSPYVNWDFAMSCDVESIVADENTSDIRYVCIGWKGTGSVPATGTGTNCTFVLTEDSTLEWLWQTNVWISLAVDGEATSTFKHGWFADDAPASVPFNAPAGLLKCVVSGDADGVTIDQAARTISIPTDRPRAVVLHIESYCESVSTNGKFVDYTLSGDAPWEPVSEASGADGRCLRSGLIASGETSVLETKVSGSGMLAFRWKTSCNRGDYCKLIVDGVEIESISRSASAWATVEHEIEGAGEHTVRWSWEKSASAALGENGAFLDDVCWKPYVTFAVASTDGTPNPATGTKRYLYGDAIDASVSEPAAANGTRRVCTGWTGTGSVPAAGAGMAVSFAITNDSTLVWNWRSEYWIDIKTRGAATTDFQAQWVPEGTTAIAEIVPSSPVAAMALLGDAQGATLDGTTLSVVANGPRTITVRATLPNISLDVASTHGTSFPAPGRNWFAWGAEVAASVSEPAPSNGVQYVCTGWIGTGDVPAHGTGTNATFVVKQASALDWTWQTNVWLSLVCEGLVAADLGGEWVEKGATRTVRYEPLAEFFTVALGGDTDGVSLNEVDRTITIPADRPRDLSLALTMHTLRSALDAEGFVWMTSNAFPWVPQAAFSSDGEDAAQSGGIATGEESILMTTLHGPGTLSWSWFLAAEGVLGVDVELDGEYMTSLETSGAWMTDSLAIEGDDDHTIRFVFWNEDPDATSRTEYAYLDQFSWTGTAPTPLATKNTPAPVLHTWLAERAPSILAGVGGDCEAAAAAKAANGRFVWECFVANINPEDPDADFRATIDWQDGHFRVGVDPDLGDKRVYEFDGKETLDAAWGPTNDLSRFFRAKVSLPPDWTPDGCIDGFPEAVTVTLDPNGGTVDPTFLSFAHPGVGLLGELPLPDRIGAFFADWHSASGVPFTAASVLPWIDFTLFAGWDIAVSFNPNGGTGAMPTLTAPLGEPLALPENGFARIGHSFGGWASTSSGAVAYQPGDEVAFDSSRTLFATWGVNQYELAFDPAGGSAIVPQTNDYASAVVPPSAPTRDGYAFKGWNPPLPETMPASNLLSTALWRLESHTLSFDSAGGSAVAPITQESGTDLVAPPAPTRTGYDFAGWSEDVPATMPGSDTTLVAQWTPHRYLVRFRQNGGTGGILDLELAYGETIALPACQCTNGVSPFIGWATIPNGSVIYDDGAEVSNLTAEDDGLVELFAIWSPGIYTIHFDPNGGAGTMPDQTCWIGIRTNLLENVFAKINRFFVGWSTNANDGAVYANRESVIDLAAVDEATTLYAVWTEIPTAPYCIIDLSGGANDSTYPVTYLAEPPEGGFNTDEYKTTKLVLRRLEPGPVPTRDATLTKPFYVGLFEVTQKQWELVTGSNPSSFSGDTRPVECVSYNDIRGSSLGSQWPASNAVDAGSFLGKLRARTGLDFDLPTEAQWEYACRAGTTTTYGYGDSANGDYMWYWDNSSRQTHAVGEKLPNAWGLYDMHGNVWEWCLDWYGSSLSGNDPVGSSSGSSRVFRGGGWYFGAVLCTSSFRDVDFPSNSFLDGGFRLVRTLSNE